MTRLEISITLNFQKFISLNFVVVSNWLRHRDERLNSHSHNHIPISTWSTNKIQKWGTHQTAVSLTLFGGGKNFLTGMMFLIQCSYYEALIAGGFVLSFPSCSMQIIGYHGWWLGGSTKEEETGFFCFYSSDSDTNWKNWQVFGMVKRGYPCGWIFYSNHRSL